MSVDMAPLHAQWRSTVSMLQGPSMDRVLPAPLQMVPDARVSNRGAGVTLFPDFLVPFTVICWVLTTRLKTAREQCPLEWGPDSSWKPQCPLSSSVWMPAPPAPAPHVSLWNQHMFRVHCFSLQLPSRCKHLPRAEKLQRRDQTGPGAAQTDSTAARGVSPGRDP